MKLQLIAAATLATLFCVPALALAEEQDFKAECKKYAEEDKIAADEMEAYVAQCMEDLAAAEAESAQEGAAESGSKD